MITDVLNARRPHIIFGIELTATSKPIVQHLSTHLSEIIQSYLPRYENRALAINFE